MQYIHQEFIYGGRYGIPLAKYLQDRGVVISGIIDNKLSDKNIQGFNMISFDNVNDGAKIFIAISDKDANKSIVEQILQVHNSTVIRKYQDLPEDDLSIIMSQTYI